MHHWGRVTHICGGNLTIIGSDNGLSPGRRQAMAWTNVEILLIGPVGTNFSEMLIEIHAFSFKKIHLKMSSGKWRSFCLGLNVLNPTGILCERIISTFEVCPRNFTSLWSCIFLPGTSCSPQSTMRGSATGPPNTPGTGIPWTPGHIGTSSVRGRHMFNKFCNGLTGGYGSLFHDDVMTLQFFCAGKPPVNTTVGSRCETLNTTINSKSNLWNTKFKLWFCVILSS